MQRWSCSVSSKDPEMRDIEKLADMEQVLRNRQEESWEEELQEIVRKRTELLPEHQKMQ